MEDLGNQEWRTMLSVFNKIITGTPPVEKVRESLISLSTSAANSVLLTIRQKEGITARCDNYLKGEYGNTKSDRNLSYGKAPEVSKDQSNGQQKPKP